MGKDWLKDALGDALKITPEQQRKVLAVFGLASPDGVMATCDVCGRPMRADDAEKWEHLVAHPACIQKCEAIAGAVVAQARKELKRMLDEHPELVTIAEEDQ